MNKLRDKRKKNWFYIENAVVDREDLSSNEKLIYMALARYANESDEAFPSYSTLSRKTSLSKRTIINGIKSLIEKKLIKKTKRYSNSSKENNSNLYTLFSAQLPSASGAPPPSKSDEPHAETQHIPRVVFPGEMGALPPSATDAPPSEMGAPPSAIDAPPSETSALPPGATNALPSAPAAPKKDLHKNTNIIKNTNLRNKNYTQIENLRLRYSENQLKIIDEYFDILRWTRKHGKIADSVIIKIYEEWKEFKVDAVMYALSVYINNPKHHDKKENYCYGIMRNATSEQITDCKYIALGNGNSVKYSFVPKDKKNAFNDFKSRADKYSNEELEKILGLRK